MIRGFYTAASGLVTQEKKLNTQANNIANIGTAGFKKDDLVLGTFGEHIAIRLNNYNTLNQNELGRGVFMQVVDSEYTDFTQGSFEHTERALDFAIQGEGFFVVVNENGDEMLTRNGKFTLDEDGYLILPGFGRVQGDGGDLQLNTAFFSVDRAGNIYLDPVEEDDEPTEVDRLLIVAPEDYDTLKKNANGTFFTEEGWARVADTATNGVLQNYFEKSNTSMTEEMTRMMASQRSLQSASQLVRMYDEMSDQATNRIARK